MRAEVGIAKYKAAATFLLSAFLVVFFHHRAAALELRHSGWESGNSYILLCNESVIMRRHLVVLFWVFLALLAIDQSEYLFLQMARCCEALSPGGFCVIYGGKVVARPMGWAFALFDGIRHFSAMMRGA